MYIDKDKLERTIQKALVPVKRHEIVVLKELPPSHTISNVKKKAQQTTNLCQATNLNGTPCKCKAKVLGKFCMKHLP